MELSLVICTRNRSSSLRETLLSLKKIRGGLDWELVVVNNGSTDDTGEVLNRFRQEFHRPFEIINEPKPGKGRALNAGWKIARGPVIAFTDDDCYPAENWLEAILACFQRDGIGFVGGRILLHDPTDFPITIQKLDRPVELCPRDFIPAGLIQGANLAFRRTALEKVNGFDVRMGPGTPFVCEELDILARLLANGYTGAYDPRPLVYHHHRRKTAAEAASLMKIYDYGRGAYYAKCLLNPVLRKVYAKNWYWGIRNQGSLTTLREALGAINFLARSIGFQSGQ